MIKKILILVLICTPVYAEVSTERYAVEKPDGKVAVAYYIPGSKDTLEEFLKSNGLYGLPFSRVKDSDIRDRSDRNFWVKEGKAIAVDTEKKAEIEEENQAKESEKEAILEKMKISKEEFEKLNGRS